MPKPKKTKTTKETPKKRVLKKRKKQRKQKTIVDSTVDMTAQGDAVNPLNARQMRFVDEYMLDFNAYRAYCMAGYTARGDSGYVCASQLLKNVKVRREVEHRKRLISQQVKVTQEDVIRELKLVAMSNIGDYVQFGGKRVRIKSSGELTRDQLSVIEQVVESTNTAGLKSIKLKLHPKLNALAVLAKYTEVDKGDGHKSESTESLAQALKEVADAMCGTLPTEENREVTSGKKKKRKSRSAKREADKECPMCEVPKKYCDCDN